ncbi:ABC transporter family substrate-binding protein [Streptomyces sp. NPDC050504]|uniref:ABC transporter family substrate-binding protein n=1 Tax=Streptomyces sp. NPDC050504 TaxID=3365618 RepID=UPI003796F42B
MSHVGADSGRTRPRPRTSSRTLRSAVFLATGVLALPLLTGCGSADEDAAAATAPQDIAPAGRELTADGGTVRWAVDKMPSTLNAFQADADGTTGRIAGAVLPSLFTLDERGRPLRNPDYLESAEVVEREPKQVVLYKLNQQAVWSDGREIGAPDFVAQWRALSGRDSSYWTARNAGYERIEKIERGANDLEVRVTFGKPYADWRALFTPLYSKGVMGTPDSFNDGARATLKNSAGPFQLRSIDKDAKTTTLVRNPRWWGRPAKLDQLVLTAVPRAARAAALAAGKVDVAEIDHADAERIELAVRDSKQGTGKGKAGGNTGAAGPQALDHGPAAELTPAQALKSWAQLHSEDEEEADAARLARKRTALAVAAYATEQRALRGFVIRRSLEPAYTQLALNGESGPLADERVRRAVARALDREELAETVLKPLGLPAVPLGSHLALAGQEAYGDGSDALGSQDAQEARALLADAGWTPGGARRTARGATEAAAGSKAKAAGEGAADEASDEGTYIVGDDSKPGAARPGAARPDDSKPGAARPGAGRPVANPGPDTVAGTRVLAPAPAAALQGAAVLRQADVLAGAAARRAVAGSDGTAARAEGAPVREKKPGGMAGAYAPVGTAAPGPAAGPAAGPLGKDGKPLTLRFVLPSSPGSQTLRTVGEHIVRMLDGVGIRTEVTKVADDSYFKDHIASGEYDLALYSWPGTAYPATDARPIFAKPEPASDGSLQVEQNYTRVGTDHIDQLFDQALGELDEEASRDLVRKADARIWAAAGSIPLFQRPELVAARPDVVNVGAFGFAAPRYQDIGFKKPETGQKAEK